MRKRLEFCMLCILILGMCTGTSSASVLLNWETYPDYTNPSIISINSYWEVSDDAALGVFTFNDSSETLDFYLEVMLDNGQQLILTDENGSQTHGGNFFIQDSDNKLHAPSDVYIESGTPGSGDWIGLGFYTDPDDDGDPNTADPYYAWCSMEYEKGDLEGVVSFAGNWVRESVNDVPEPASIWLLLTGFCGFLHICINRKNL